MNNETKDGGPAFPVIERQEHVDGQAVCAEWPGMTLLDWFAGQALIGIISRVDIANTEEPERAISRSVGAAYDVAEKMLEYKVTNYPEATP